MKPNILSMKCELVADTLLPTALQNNSGVTSLLIGNKYPQILPGTIYGRNLPDSKARLDLLNKQISDSNLSVYTDADLQCK